MTDLITQHLDLWASAIKRKSSAGRGSSSKVELYGIKKLRELILELAVRGLLVPQDPQDEPASELLKRIAIDKARLIKEKVIRNSRPLAAISDEEKFMSLPAGWDFARLNDLGDWGAGATPSRNNPELYGGGIPWFKSGELVSDYISQSEETVTELALEKASLRYNKVGDVLIAMYGATIGKTAILSVPATTNQAVCACTPFPGFENTYLLMLLKAYKPRFIGMGAGGAQPNISREKIIDTVVAVPPTPEQHRIVAKVDELMALCDQLEQQSNASLAAHQTLVATLLNALTSAAARPELVEGQSQIPARPEPVEGQSQIPVRPELVEGGAALVRQAHHSAPTAFDEAWQRIADHFDTLFTTEESIDQLKQTILQLAVMGKLVPQDPNDEPASELLKKIAAEKARLVKEGQIKKEKPLPPISDRDLQVVLPHGWSLARLGSFVSIVRGITFPASEKNSAPSPGLVACLRTANVQTEIDWEDLLYINSSFIRRNDQYLQAGDIVMSMANSRELVGKVAYTGLIPVERATFGGFLGVIRPYQLSASYLMCVLRAPQARASLIDSASQTTNIANISLEKLNPLVVALPPLPEQHRIVAKVDELMALCDQLKAGLSAAQTTQLQLADALTEQALA